MKQRAYQYKNMEYFMETYPIYLSWPFCDIKNRADAVRYAARRNDRKQFTAKGFKCGKVKYDSPAHQQIKRSVKPSRSIKPAKLYYYSRNGKQPYPRKKHSGFFGCHAMKRKRRIAARNQNIYQRMIQLSKPKQHLITAFVKMVKGAGPVKCNQRKAEYNAAKQPYRIGLQHKPPADHKHASYRSAAHAYIVCQTAYGISCVTINIAHIPPRNFII